MCSALAYYGAKKIYITDVFEESSKALVEDINKNFAPVAEFCPAGDFSQSKRSYSCIKCQWNRNGQPYWRKPTSQKNSSAKISSILMLAITRQKLSSYQTLKKLEQQVLNGLGMSLYQGAAQIEYWTGQEPPIEAMRQKLLDIISEK